MEKKILYPNILLAEDDSEDYDFFREAVNSLAPVTLSRVSDGEELMNILREQRFQSDIIYLDINMPRKNGIECLKEIRGFQNYSSLPVIIMSSTHDETIIKNLYETGANYYFCKPATFQDLKDTIEKTLSTEWRPGVSFSRDSRL